MNGIPASARLIPPDNCITVKGTLSSFHNMT